MQIVSSKSENHLVIWKKSVIHDSLNDSIFFIASVTDQLRRSEPINMIFWKLTSVFWEDGKRQGQILNENFIDFETNPFI